MKRSQIALVGVVILLLAAFIFYKFYRSKHVDLDGYFLGDHVSDAPINFYDQAAVASDASQCAVYGKQMLAKNGSAIDAAISVALCMAIVIPHTMGLGGGCYINYYDSESKKSFIFDGREEAPGLASVDMFKGNGTAALVGALGIAIPGELAAYYQAHQRFGRLPWRELFEGPIQLAQQGFRVNAHLSTNLKIYETRLKQSNLRDMFTDPKTGEIYKEGDIIKNPKLALTYKTLAASSSPMELFYRGDLMKDIVADIQARGGQITEDDFRNYQVKTYEAEKYNLPNGYTLHVPKAPSSGQLLGFLTTLMANYTDLCKPEVGRTLESAAQFYHVFIEACKFTYSRRMGLGDPDFDDITPLLGDISPDTFNQPASFFQRALNKLDRDHTHNTSFYGGDFRMKEDHGTAHLSVIDAKGNAVSMTSSLNMYFGAQVMSPSTGILFNDQMDDFSSPNITNYFGVPPSQMNRIAPRKRPLSSMCPTVVTQQGTNNTISLGAAGGTLIISGVAQTLIRVLYMNQNLKQAIDQYRFHHQLFPNQLYHEPNFNKNILRLLNQKYGHTLAPIINRRSILTGVQRFENKFSAYTDFRKGGSIDGL